MFRNKANICKIVQVNNITMLIKFKPLGTQHTCYNWMVSTTDKLVQVLARWTYTGLARADRAGYSHTRLSPARWIKPDPAVSYSLPHHLCTGTHRKEKKERKNTRFKQLCKPEVRTGQNWIKKKKKKNQFLDRNSLNGKILGMHLIYRHRPTGHFCHIFFNGNKFKDGQLMAKMSF